MAHFIGKFSKCTRIITIMISVLFHLCHFILLFPWTLPTLFSDWYYPNLGIFCTADFKIWGRPFLSPKNMIWVHMQSAAGTEWLLISRASFHFHFSYHLQALHSYVQSGKPTLGSTGAYRPPRGKTDGMAKQPGSLTDVPDWGEGAAQSHAVREHLTPSPLSWKVSTSFPQFGTGARMQAPSQACAALNGELRVKAPLALGSGRRHTLT